MPHHPRFVTRQGSELYNGKRFTQADVYVYDTLVCWRIVARYPAHAKLTAAEYAATLNLWATIAQNKTEPKYEKELDSFS